MNNLKKGSTLLLVLLIAGSGIPTIKAEEEQQNDLLSNAITIGEWVDTSNGPHFKYYDESLLQSKKQVYTREALPEKYDLRKEGLVTPVKESRCYRKLLGIWRNVIY